MFTEPVRLGRLLRWGAFAAALSLVIVATLLPTGYHTHGFARCIFCNPRTFADSLVNIGLFFPIGITLRLLGLGPFAAAGLGALLSSGVEIAQLWVPGRDATLSDIITNTAGTALSALGFDLFRSGLVPSPAASERLALGAAMTASLVFWTTGYLVRPSLPASEYWGQWTPRLESLEPYHGHVNAVTVGDMAVEDHRVADSAGLRARLVAGQPIQVDVTTGPPPTRLSSIFSIADVDSRRILLVGAVGDDLAVRYRTRAADWYFDQPDIRSPKAFTGLDPGSRATIDVRKADKGYCVRVGAGDACDLGYGPGDGWSLLVSSSVFTTGMRSVMQAFWMAAVVAPVGYWARRGPLSGLALAVLAICLFGLPWVTELLPTRPQEWMGVLFGLGTAGMLGWRSR